MNKRVLMISQCFYPEIGSAGNRMKNIFKLLIKEGYEVEVLTTEPSYPNKKIYTDKKFWDDEELNNKTNSITRITVKNRKYSQSVINRLYYYIEIMIKMIIFISKNKNAYDIIFVSSPPIFLGLVGLVAKIRYNNSRLVLDIRDLWPESLKGVGVFNYKPVFWVFNYLEKMLYKQADDIIVNSFEFISHIMKKGNIPRNKIGFIPNSAMKSELFISASNQDKNSFKVIYTGNIGLAQDIDILKELAVNLASHNISLSIVGYGMKKNELVDFVKKENLNNVQFFSPMTRKECFEINRQHHVGFVSLNDKEVFNTVLPGKIIDYLTCGLPIVASVSGYAKQIIEKEQAGFVSETRDINELVDYILFLSNNFETRQKLGENGQQFIRKHFLWEKNVRELVFRIEQQEVDGNTIVKTKF